jgi:hypothetical protein
MAIKRLFTLPELAALADRMAARGSGNSIMKDKNLLTDCLLCGRVLAQLVATGAVEEPFVLGDHSASPPTAPE